jgi:hypothetical protein
MTLEVALSEISEIVKEIRERRGQWEAAGERIHGG